MRRLRLIAVLLPVVGLLAACSGSFSVTVNFPVTPTPVAALGPSGNTTAVATATLAPGGVRYYEIDVSSSQQVGYDVLQVELDHNLNLTFYGPSGSALSSSSSPSYFASGTLGLSSLAASVAPAGASTQGIAVTRTCLGSCVVQKLDSGTFYIRVANQTSSTSTVHIYAFVRSYDDLGEPGNDTQSGALTLAAGSSGDSGAIETLRDTDFWIMGATGTLTFDGGTAVNARADVFDGTSGAFVTTVLPGGSTSVFAGDVVEVYAKGDARAGVSGTSGYFLTLN